jgi:hypothetical protein
MTLNIGKQTYGETGERAPPRKRIHFETTKANFHRHRAELTKNQSHTHRHFGNCIDQSLALALPSVTDCRTELVLSLVDDVETYTHSQLLLAKPWTDSVALDYGRILPAVRHQR